MPYPVGCANRPTVSSLGARRRVQALCADGHNQAAIAAVAGISIRSISNALSADRIYRWTDDAIRGAYDRLSPQPGTNHRTRYMARAAGWPGPWCWAPGTIDDPNAGPDLCDHDPDKVDVDLLTERIRAGRVDPRDLTRADRKRVTARLVTEQSMTMTSKMLHMSGRRVLQIAESL